MCFQMKNKIEILVMTKKLYLNIRYFVLYQNFTTERVKIVKNSRLIQIKKKFKFKFFFLNCQIPGKVATPF